jgi:hypothetical protein
LIGLFEGFTLRSFGLLTFWLEGLFSFGLLDLTLDFRDFLPGERGDTTLGSRGDFKSLDFNMDDRVFPDFLLLGEATLDSDASFYGDFDDFLDFLPDRSPIVPPDLTGDFRSLPNFPKVGDFDEWVGLYLKLTVLTPFLLLRCVCTFVTDYCFSVIRALTAFADLRSFLADDLLVILDDLRMKASLAERESSFLVEAFLLRTFSTTLPSSSRD